METMKIKQFGKKLDDHEVPRVIIVHIITVLLKIMFKFTFIITRSAYKYGQLFTVKYTTKTMDLKKAETVFPVIYNMGHPSSSHPFTTTRQCTDVFSEPCCMHCYYSSDICI